MERRYVGIDLHRRRSVIVTMDEAGEVLSSVRIPNDPVAMSIAVAEAGEGAEAKIAMVQNGFHADRAGIDARNERAGGRNLE